MDTIEVFPQDMLVGDQILGMPGKHVVEVKYMGTVQDGIDAGQGSVYHIHLSDGKVLSAHTGKNGPFAGGKKRVIRHDPNGEPAWKPAWATASRKLASRKQALSGDEYDLIICYDCHATLANGGSYGPDGSWYLDGSDQPSRFDPLSLIPDSWHVMLGDAYADFSSYRCDGCGNNLGGARYTALGIDPTTASKTVTSVRDVDGNEVSVGDTVVNPNGIRLKVVELDGDDALRVEQIGDGQNNGFSPIDSVWGNGVRLASKKTARGKKPPQMKGDWKAPGSQWDEADGEDGEDYDKGEQIRDSNGRFAFRNGPWGEDECLTSGLYGTSECPNCDSMGTFVSGKQYVEGTRGTQLDRRVFAMNVTAARANLDDYVVCTSCTAATLKTALPGDTGDKPEGAAPQTPLEGWDNAGDMDAATNVNEEKATPAEPDRDPRYGDEWITDPQD